jgi:hypothetical protein
MPESNVLSDFLFTNHVSAQWPITSPHQTVALHKFAIASALAFISRFAQRHILRASVDNRRAILEYAPDPQASRPRILMASFGSGLRRWPNHYLAFAALRGAVLFEGSRHSSECLRRTKSRTSRFRLLSPLLGSGSGSGGGADLACARDWLGAVSSARQRSCAVVPARQATQWHANTIKTRELPLRCIAKRQV